VAAECVNGCEYQHLSTSPILTEIDNEAPVVGDTITLTGMNLANIETVLLMSGDSKENVETSYATRSDTSVTFELPPVYAGGHYVYLH
jgi:hypothetical protein